MSRTTGPWWGMAALVLVMACGVDEERPAPSETEAYRVALDTLLGLFAPDRTIGASPRLLRVADPPTRVFFGRTESDFATPPYPALVEALQARGVGLCDGELPLTARCALEGGGRADVVLLFSGLRSGDGEPPQRELAVQIKSFTSSESGSEFEDVLIRLRPSGSTWVVVELEAVAHGA